MKNNEYRYKLHDLFKLSGEEKPFLEWLIDETERNHKKQVKMAGYLGEAFSCIGELESELKSMVSSSEVIERTFTFDQMMDVITEFSDNVNTNTFYSSGNELKTELIPHIKTTISILDSDL